MHKDMPDMHICLSLKKCLVNVFIILKVYKEYFFLFVGAQIINRIKKCVLCD